MYMSALIYDTIERKIVQMKPKPFSLKYNVDLDSVCCLIKKRAKTVHGRFCLLENKDDLVFTLVDVKSREEFECLTNISLFRHKNIPYDETQAKYVYKLKKKEQITATICGRLFCLKERLHEVKIKFVARTNGAYLFPDEVSEFDKDTKKQKVIRNLLRRRIIHAVNRQKSRKETGTVKLLGCSIEYFIKHLENQFRDGMTWENRGKERGKWHIDHIRPCNTFDLTKESEQKLCFHYTNLRPLWSEDNVSRPRNGCDMFGHGLDI